MPIRVGIIEDHYLMIKAIEDILSSQPDIVVVGKATHGNELQRLVRENKPDVVILDLGMSTGNFEPITAVRSLLAEYPHVRILVLTGYDDDVYVRELVNAGAYGYVLKSDDLSLMLANGIRMVHAGSRFFSQDILDKFFNVNNQQNILNEHELAVLRLAARGLNNAKIADALNMSEKRVRNLLSAIYRKFAIKESDGVNPRMASINKAREAGLLPNE